MRLEMRRESPRRDPLSHLAVLLATILAICACSSKTDPTSAVPADQAPRADAATDSDPTSSPAPVANAPDGVQRANPASENCIKEGGQSRAETSPTGGQYSVCVFEDNHQCEEWAMLRVDCRKPCVRITGYATDAGRFCAISGGSYAVTSAAGAPETGTCTFKGNTCDAEEFYRGECGR